MTNAPEGLSLLGAVVLYGLSAATVQAEQCKELVFNAYCLGGDISELEKAKRPFGKYFSGPRILLLYPDGADVILVQGFTGKIMSVSRMAEPGTLPNYLDFKSRIEKAYGPGTDESYFPDQAPGVRSNPATEDPGRGTIKHLWERDGWSIILLWPSAESVTLWYLDNGLYEKYRSGNPEGL